jgi:hypothetical protein
MRCTSQQQGEKMFYTANPHRDAEAYEAHQDDLQSRSEALSFAYRNEIEDGFKTFSELPYVTGVGRIRMQSFSEVASDLIADDKIFAEFVKVLKTSECPKVKALVDSMNKHYTGYWLGDLVEAV